MRENHLTLSLIQK